MSDLILGQHEAKIDYLTTTVERIDTKLDGVISTLDRRAGERGVLGWAGHSASAAIGAAAALFLDFLRHR